MSEVPDRPPAADEPPIHERTRAVQSDLKARAKVLTASAGLLGPLTKPAAFEDLKKLDAALAKARKKLATFESVPKLAAQALDAVDGWAQERRRSLRERLGRELGAACERAGLTMRVVSREAPAEIRIPPLAVRVDFERGSAELRFAQEPLGQVAADAEAIVAAVVKTKAALDRSLDAAAFFDACLAAWKAARVATGAPERVEILDFLPYLAIGMQKPGFRSAPTKENFVSYPRAQFAYDVLRLRRELGFSRNGYRMNLGVATGTTASQKKRVVYLEDEDGVGEYKLTVFFTKEESPT